LPLGGGGGGFIFLIALHCTALRVGTSARTSGAMMNGCGLAAQTALFCTLHIAVVVDAVLVHDSAHDALGPTRRIEKQQQQVKKKKKMKKK